MNRTLKIWTTLFILLKYWKILLNIVALEDSMIYLYRLVEKINIYYENRLLYHYCSFHNTKEANQHFCKRGVQF